MKQIKTLTLDSVDYFSEVLSENTKKANKEEIKNKTADFISQNGSRKFIDLYNKSFSQKKYAEVLETIKV
jgi:hypothetical protein